ncbi:MAG: anhydro-N-acetylmuramic acid kinase, partial [Saprospiraceae bacterium]
MKREKKKNVLPCRQMEKKSKKYSVLGLMSGSSLDGLDIALCSFTLSEKGMEWSIDIAETIPFSEKWMARLIGLPRSLAIDFYKTHTYFGHYMAELVNPFLKKYQIEPDFIASHGHTIYHYPNKMMTCQIGDGAALAAKTGLPVICDFRTHDVALQGEGTPLAPTADRFLFNGFDYYLNLGGIANISFHHPQWTAYDVVPCNQVLNFLAQEKNLAYDKDGYLAKSGNIIPELLEELQGDKYFSLTPPKSLDNVGLLTKYIPIIQKYDSH